MHFVETLRRSECSHHGVALRFFTNSFLIFSVSNSKFPLFCPSIFLQGFFIYSFLTRILGLNSHSNNMLVRCNLAEQMDLTDSFSVN